MRTVFARSAALFSSLSSSVSWRSLARVSAGICGFSLVAMSTGCNFDELRTLDIDAESRITVPGSPLGPANPLLPEQIFPADFGELMAQEISRTFSTEGVDKDAVDSLKLSSMRVEVVDAVENGRTVRDLSFLESLQFSLAAGDVGPEVVAFSGDNVFVEGLTAYDFELTNTELANMLKADAEMGMDAEVTPSGSPNFDTELIFSVTLTVLINPLGAINGTPNDAAQ